MAEEGGQCVLRGEWKISVACAAGTKHHKIGGLQSQRFTAHYS